ncbi:Response regulator [Sulfidibacter corallicola]|uniref:Response regulator n=1 Tax=Sulfidibacter corallicola TaxID=2818388 RepID=A0A8A4TN97_SULCO|nr:response regulator [Sulfidibacter corallicola]QTD50572.1 response regulator [Sulfidibacter corallicola]
MAVITERKINVTFLMADDDRDDRDLTLRAFQKARIRNDLRFVEDGVELLDYLRRRGLYADPRDSPRPHLILLDLNMPRKDGREALAEIKADPELRRIPVVVLTTSEEEADILKSYDLGANSFISKPVSFDSLMRLLQDLDHYWLEIVTTTAPSSR